MDDSELAALHLRLFEPGRSDGSRNEAANELIATLRGERETSRALHETWKATEKELAGERVRASQLADALADANKVLVFADGLSVAESGFALADLYAADCEWAQNALSLADCHGRGVVSSTHEATK